MTQIYQNVVFVPLKGFYTDYVWFLSTKYKREQYYKRNINKIPLK